MKASIARPTLTLTEISVRAGQWESGLASATVLNADFRSWDARTPVRFRRAFALDFELAVAQLDVKAQVPSMLLVVRRGTGYGQLPRELETIVREEIKPERNEFLLDQIMDSANLAGQLWLLTDIVLAENFDGGGPLSPSLPGTKLWSDSYAVPLEPDVMRFPTEIGSFAALFPNRAWCHAPWCLRWYSADPERDLANALRLYLNADRESHCERIKALDPVVLEAMMADVMGQLIERAGLIDGHPDEEGWPAGSVGQQALSWRKLAFPRQSADEVREILRHRPGEFRASILAAAELAVVHS